MLILEMLTISNENKLTTAARECQLSAWLRVSSLDVDCNSLRILFCF